MDLDDVIKLAFKISSSLDMVEEQAPGDEDELPAIRTKIKGRRKQIRLIVKDIDN